MITETDKQKITQFITNTTYEEPDWNNHSALSNVLDILKAFNNDPDLAAQYWNDADQKAKAAVKTIYRQTVHKMGLSLEHKISHADLLAYFNGDQLAVDQFFDDLQAKGQKASKQIFHDNFTAVVLHLLGQKNTVQ